jgi:hypothetical protein
MELERKWRCPAKDWPSVYAQLSILFEFTQNYGQSPVPPIVIILQGFPEFPEFAF